MLQYIFLSFSLVFLLSVGLFSMLKANFGIEIPVSSEIFLTEDFGEKWVKIKNPVKESLEIDNFVFDPSDPENVYVATVKGVFQTKGGKESYKKEENFYLASVKKVPLKEDKNFGKDFLPPGQKPALVSKFIYDPHNKNILYFIGEEVGRNKLFKSSDDGENFEPIFISQKDDKITSFEPSPLSSKILYVGTQKGEILRSDDYGNSWEKRGNFFGRVKQIGVNPVRPDEIYVVTSAEHHPTAIPPDQSFIPGMIYKSTDFGESFKKLEIDLEIEEVNFAFTQNRVYLVSKFSIAQIEGKKTKYLNLPSGETEITAFTIDPKNSNILYLGQGGTFYKSYNAGFDWQIIELPKRGKIEGIVINNRDTSKVMIEMAQTF